MNNLLITMCRMGMRSQFIPCESPDKAVATVYFGSQLLFIVDQHLGKLDKTLRFLGFDTSFDKKWDDIDLIRHSNRQGRMILTRDIELLKNGDTKFGYWVRSPDPDQQIKELFERFDLAGQVNPFTRCMKYNGILHNVELEKVDDRIPPKVKKWHSDFFECSNCGQVYWQGSHYKKPKQKVDELLKIDRKSSG